MVASFENTVTKKLEKLEKDIDRLEKVCAQQNALVIEQRRRVNRLRDAVAAMGRGESVDLARLLSSLTSQD